eukprot:scaffold763_cov98-Cylindrotheca_fusiformis.AAC.11
MFDVQINEEIRWLSQIWRSRHSNSLTFRKNKNTFQDDLWHDPRERFWSAKGCSVLFVGHTGKRTRHKVNMNYALQEEQSHFPSFHTESIAEFQYQ